MSLPIIVFVGPSFPPERVHELVPTAEVRPPVRRGDLTQIAGPALVAIIDGVFDAELSVAPREIRNAIARGVRVVGSSSMGALRAAEVHEMIGVGRIYEKYRDGTFQRDDEVAILLDSETGRALTEPLANIRFAVDTLVQSGSLDEEKGAAIVQAASDMHFHDRVYRNILREAGLGDAADVEHLVLALKSVDLKREDAHTLLEQLDALGEDPRWSNPRKRIERPEDEEPDDFDAVQIPKAAQADAPIRIWEFGESISWKDLFVFLALTGDLEAPIRRALARAEALHGAPPPDDAEPPEAMRPVYSVQELFDVIRNEWGWNSPEEVHVTLNDLGIGFDDLHEQLRGERALQKRIRALVTSRSEPLLRAVKLDLLMSDLGLKREAMRLGSLQVLAGRAPPSPLEDEEIREAKRAILCRRAQLNWNGLLDESDLTEAEAAPFVTLLARARRIGVPLLALMESGPAAESRAGEAISSLPRASHAQGSTRSIPNDEAAAIARKLGDVIGVTRVAQLGELERFGLHVTAAYRPSEWSSSLGSGKSESLEGAIAGALMEELEKYAQEKFAPKIVAQATFSRLGRPAVDPAHCALPYDTGYSPEASLGWSEMMDLVTGGEVLVPQAVITMHRTRGDILHSPRRGRKVFNTNGLASGFSLTEALLHALCERIERHAVKLAEQAVSNPGAIPTAAHWPFTFIDLDTCPAPSRRIIQAVRGAGFEVRVMDITSEIGVPTFAARIVRPAALHGMEDKYCPGACAHPNPAIALDRAILEAVQTRVAGLSGAREDFSVKARSLGRHERPRPMSRGDAYWIRPYVPKKPLAAVRGLLAEDARSELDFVVRRLTAAGFERVLYSDLSRPETEPAKVVRVLIPDMEDINPFYTGPRARTLMVQDSMRRHGW